MGAWDFSDQSQCPRRLALTSIDVGAGIAIGQVNADLNPKQRTVSKTSPLRKQYVTVTNEGRHCLTDTRPKRHGVV